MNILGIDTSGPCAAVSLMKDNRIVADLSISHQKTHSVFLMPMIQNMLQSTDTKLGEMDCFACGVGPGSFTGVRIGVTTAKTFAQAMGKPCVAVDSLQALAYSQRHFGGVVVAMTDARRQRVFACAMKGEEVVLPSDVLPLVELFGRLGELHQPILLVGDGAVSYAPEIRDSGLNHVIDGQRMMQAGFVIEAALGKIQRGELETYLSLLPNYVMKSKAEREADANR